LRLATGVALGFAAVQAVRLRRASPRPVWAG
jgi:hypothetical protein